MKKAILFVAVSAFVGFTALNASADDMVPGTYYQGQVDSSVMGVGQTMMQMGAKDRVLTNAVNLGSGAGRSRSDTGIINGNYQFGSSQTEQSWKAVKRFRKLRYMDWFRVTVRATTLRTRIVRQ